MENKEFKELEVSEELLHAIEDMGFTHMTPIQAESIPFSLKGRDVIAKAPTGTGKTCAYGIPAIENIDLEDKNVQVLVLCPTRELAIQSVGELTKLAKYKPGIKTIAIYGGQGIDRQIGALRNNPQIIIGTPGRIMDHLRRKTLRLNNIRTLILDEADEMLNMGFREDIDTILNEASHNHQTMLFSATMPKPILDITKKYQHNAITVKAAREERNLEPIKQYYIELKENEKEDAIARLLTYHNYKLALVFAATKKRVDELSLSLSSKGFNAEALHGDLKQVQRDKVMAKFRHGLVNILVATDVAARGIDVDDVEAVFNYDIPDEDEYYVHRIGRTGRAGKEGDAFTFMTRKQTSYLKTYAALTKFPMKKIMLPSQKDVEQAKIVNFLNDLDFTAIEPYKGYITDLSKVNSISVVDIAAALLKKATYVEPKENIVNSMNLDELKEAEKQASKKKESSPNAQRFFLNIGRKDGANNIDIIALVSNAIEAPVGEVEDILLKEAYCFVEIDKKYEEKILNNLNGQLFNNREITVEVASGQKKEKSSSSRRGGRRRRRR